MLDIPREQYVIRVPKGNCRPRPWKENYKVKVGAEIERVQRTLCQGATAVVMRTIAHILVQNFRIERRVYIL